MPNILLHICCGPCATAVIKYLKEKDLEVTGFFYNPNIQPQEEHDRRLKSLQDYMKKQPIDLIKESTGADYDTPYKQAVKTARTKEERCLACYDLRLRETAKQAQQMDFDYFTTTLLASPQQDIEAIRKIGKKYEEEFEVAFYYPDSGRKKFKGFRPLFTTGRQLAKAAKLYEQKYCGCLASQKEAVANDSGK